MLDENSSKDHLKKIGISIPKFLSGNSEKLIENLHKLNFPLALKMLSQKIEHKSEAGVLSLNLKNEKDLKEEIISIKNKVESNEPANTPILTPSMYSILLAKAKFPTKRLIVKPIPVKIDTA